MMYYDRIEATHARLLASYGQGSFEIGRTETVSDPDDPFSPPTSTVVWYPVKAVVQGIAAEYADGTTIKTTDLSVQCGVPAIVPDVGDPVRVDGGASLTIMVVTQIPAAGDPVGYSLIVRRG